MERETIIAEVGHLLDQLEHLAETGRRLPWGHHVLVDADALRTTVEHLRHVLPEEMRQAQWIIQERERIIQEAGSEADQLVSQALDRAHAMANDSEVVKEAEARARDIIRAAEARAREIHRGALAYADDVLAKLDNDVARLKAMIDQNRQALRPPEAVNE